MGAGTRRAPSEKLVEALVPSLQVSDELRHSRAVRKQVHRDGSGLARDRDATAQRRVREEGVAVGSSESRSGRRGAGRPELLKPTEAEQCLSGGAALRCDDGLLCGRVP